MQVPTPVNHDVQSKQHEAAAQGSGKPCDVAASPTKVRGRAYNVLLLHSVCGYCVDADNLALLRHVLLRCLPLPTCRSATSADKGCRRQFVGVAGEGSDRQHRLCFIGVL